MSFARRTAFRAYRSVGKLWVIVSICAAAQTVRIVDVPGSPEGIESIAQDGDNYLWLGTSRGAFRFDGARFEPVGPREATFRIVEDGTGWVWIVRYGGIARARGRQWVHTGDGPIQNAAGGKGVFYVVRNERLQQYSIIPDGSISVRDSPWVVSKDKTWGVPSADNDGNLLIPSTREVFQIDRATLRATEVPPLRAIDSSTWNWVGQTGDGHFWAQSYSELVRYDPAQGQVRRSTHDMMGTFRPSIDRSGRLWAGRYGGNGNERLLLAIDGSNSNRYETPRLVCCVAETKDGTLWAGGAALGRITLDTIQWNLPTSQSTYSRVVSDGAEAFWGAATGLFKFGKNGPERVVGTRSPVIDNWPGRSGLILALYGGYLHLPLRGELPPPKRTSAPSAIRFCEDTRLGPWLAYADGLTRIDEFGNALEVTAPLPGGLRPVDCVVDSAGRLWAGSVNAISAWENGAWKTYSTADGMPVRGARQLAIHEKKLWFSAHEEIEDIATLSLESGKPVWQRFGPATGHAGGVTRALDTDSRGWLWRAGSRLGLQACAARCEQASNWVAILDQDGLESNNLGQGQWGEALGRVWAGVGTVLHEITVDPTMFTRNPDPLLTAPRLTRDGSTVRAEFGSTYFRHRSALEVRYRMKPGESEWKPARGWATHYERLWPGTYTFEVQARAGRGEWHASIARASITVPPPWREISLGAGLLAAVVGALGLRRRKQLDPYFAAKLLFERAKALTAAERTALFARADPKVVEEVKALLELHEADDELPPVFPDPLLGGRYRLEREIASGGFATVYRARDMRLNERPTAIKILNEAAPEKAIERESSALSMVRHEGVVGIYDRGVTREGQAYLALEFVEGATIRALCTAPQPIERVREWAAQAGEILAAVHACGVVHRDLKPENVMLEPSGRLRVIDFGIASTRAGGEHSTWANRLAGSLEYMAPEQLYGQALPATDVYALALIVVECLTGRRVTPAAAEWGVTVDGAARRLLEAAGLGGIDLSHALTFDPHAREADARAIARMLT